MQVKITIWHSFAALAKTEIAQDEAIANLLDRPQEGARVVAWDSTPEPPTRLRRLCVWGWIAAGFFCLLTFAATFCLSQAAATERHAAREAQTMAQEYLTELAATRIKLGIAEDRLEELGEPLDVEIVPTEDGPYRIFRKRKTTDMQPRSE